MCDQWTYAQIENAVEAKMKEGQMFTAFDITLILQSQKVGKLHRKIRRDIKTAADQLMAQYNYDRTIIHFAEIEAHAFVYHPYGTNANRHSPSIRPRELTLANS
jgi:hypothetical protein